jgi:hypothetical protein
LEDEGVSGEEVWSVKLKVKDLVATGLVAAIAVPYVGYLINGEMPFVKDPRGMAAAGMVLGIAAYLALEWGDALDMTDRVETGIAFVAMTFGLATLSLAETAAAEVLLAIFMGSVLMVWAVKLADHAGVLPMAKHPTGKA